MRKKRLFPDCVEREEELFGPLDIRIEIKRIKSGATSLLIRKRNEKNNVFKEVTGSPFRDLECKQ